MLAVGKESLQYRFLQYRFLRNRWYTNVRIRRFLFIQLFRFTKHLCQIFYSEKNPLALGTIWEMDGENIHVHIFDNKEDYENL